MVIDFSEILPVVKSIGVCILLVVIGVSGFKLTKHGNNAENSKTSSADKK